MLVGRFGRGQQKQAEEFALAIATLKRDLATAQIKYHHETMVATTMKIQLDSARDSLSNVRTINESLKRCLSTEKKLARDSAVQNAMLRSELTSFEETFGRQAAMLEEREHTIDRLRETVEGLEAALKAKVAEVEAAVDGERAQARALLDAEEQIKSAKSKSASLGGISLESLLKKGGFESEKELVQYVKSRDAQDKHIERLERRVQDAQDEKNEEILLRKETEKIVRQQKKEIVALEKRLAKEGTKKRSAKKALGENAADADAVQEKKAAKLAMPKKTVVKTIEVDMNGGDDVSVWNPDSARETGDSQQETAERIEAVGEAGFSARDDADKENPRVAVNTVAGVLAAKAPNGTMGTTSAATATTTNSKKRNLLTVQRASTMSTSMIGVTRKMGSFSIPKLN